MLFYFVLYALWTLFTVNNVEIIGRIEIGLNNWPLGYISYRQIVDALSNLLFCDVFVAVAAVAAAKGRHCKDPSDKYSKTWPERTFLICYEAQPCPFQPCSPPLLTWRWFSPLSPARVFSLPVWLSVPLLSVAISCYLPIAPHLHLLQLPEK